jgi:hypothetical protein
VSASGAGGPRVRRLFRRAAEADDLSGILFQGIGAVVFAIGSALASGVLTLADIIIVPMQALTTAVGDLINAIFGGAADIIGAGAVASATSLLGRFNIGPFTFALGIASVLLGLLAVNAYLSYERTGNVAIGLPFDVPTPGVEGPEEEEPEG